MTLCGLTLTISNMNTFTQPMPAVARLLVHFREKFPSREAHDELDWMVISSLPPSLIARGNITLRDWYHAVRRHLSHRNEEQEAHRRYLNGM